MKTSWRMLDIWLFGVVVGILIVVFSSKGRRGSSIVVLTIASWSIAAKMKYNSPDVATIRGRSLLLGAVV